ADLLRLHQLVVRVIDEARSLVAGQVEIPIVTQTLTVYTCVLIEGVTFEGHHGAVVVQPTPVQESTPSIVISLQGPVLRAPRPNLIRIIDHCPQVTGSIVVETLALARLLIAPGKGSALSNDTNSLTSMIEACLRSEMVNRVIT